METIYDLRIDPMLKSMQRASLSNESVGLKITHGLVGSEQWWDNIHTGLLSLETAKGVISQVWTGRPGDFPEFEMVTSTGQTSRWICSVDQSTASYELRLGRRVEVDYVVQEFKSTIYKPTMQLVVAVRLGPN